MSFRTWAGGVLERAALEITGDYTDQRLAATYSQVTGAVISGGIAAVEAVAGRVASMLSVARVSGGPRAAQALTPTVLAMIGRSLIERGESLHAVKVSRTGSLFLVPAQETWTVYGGEDPEDWVIDATLTGAETVWQYVAPRPAWLHIIRDASPGYPWRGVSALQRAPITNALASAAEDALFREAQMPTKALIPMPQGNIDKGTLRNDIQNRAYQVAFPETTAGGFGSGRTSAPTTDWNPKRLLPMPDAGLVQASSDAQARVVAALGAHPALIGGGTRNGGVDREAVKQFRMFLMKPIARLLEENALRAFGERITLSWPPSVDALLVKARAADTLTKMGVDPQAALHIARVTMGPVKMAPKPAPLPIPDPEEGDE